MEKNCTVHKMIIEFDYLLVGTFSIFRQIKKMSQKSKEAGDMLSKDEEEETSASSVKVHKLKGVKDGQYSNPVFKKLSVINGEINRMTRDDLTTKLDELKLDSRYICNIYSLGRLIIFKLSGDHCRHISQ
jgi:hypothetical protein